MNRNKFIVLIVRHKNLAIVEIHNVKKNIVIVLD